MAYVDKTSIDGTEYFLGLPRWQGTLQAYQNLTAEEEAQYVFFDIIDDGGFGDSYDIPHNSSNVGDDLDMINDNIAPYWSEVADNQKKIGELYLRDSDNKLIRISSITTTPITTVIGQNTDIAKEFANAPLKSDLASIKLTGTTNTTGSTISSGTYFYINNEIVRAKTDIANNATLTLNTNYEKATDGALNELKSSLNEKTTEALAQNIKIATYHKVAVLEFDGELSSTINTGTAPTVYTLASKYRPYNTIYGAVHLSGAQTGKLGLVAVKNTGEVVIYNYSGSNTEYVYGSIAYILG